MKQVLFGFGAFGLLLLPIQRVSADNKAVTGDMMTMPHTALEHQAMADAYKAKAAEYRKDAQFHRQMLADYAKGVPASPKAQTENSWIKKERLHCEKYIKEAEGLAAQADQFAQFHIMNAKEM